MRGGDECHHAWKGTAHRRRTGSWRFPPAFGSTRRPRRTWLLLGELRTGRSSAPLSEHRAQDKGELMELGGHGSQFEQRPRRLQKHVSAAVPAPPAMDEEDEEVLSTLRVSALGAEDTKPHPVRVGLTDTGCVGRRLAGRRYLFEAPCCYKEKKIIHFEGSNAGKKGTRAGTASP